MAVVKEEVVNMEHGIEDILMTDTVINANHVL